jgi:hypothetical protein
LAAIKEISEIAAKLAHHSFSIGKITNDLIERAGGTGYGDQVIHRIALHPKIGCSEQHLRRCWEYHRVYAAYGAELEKFPLCESGKYELARFLDKDLGQSEEKRWIFACAKRAQEENQSVEEIARSVSNILNQLDKLRKRNHATPRNQQQATPKSKLDAGWPHTGIESFKAAAEVFDKLAPPEHHAHLGRNELGRGLIIVLRPLIGIAKSLTNKGPDPDLAIAFRAFGNVLIDCASQLQGQESADGLPAATEPITVPRGTGAAGSASTAASSSVTTNTPSGKGRGRPRKLRVEQQVETNTLILTAAEPQVGQSERIAA